MSRRLLAFIAVFFFVAAPSLAQWNPSAGQWGKTNPADLRVMTWNVQDGICSSNNKVEGLNSWNGLARIVAAMKPDLLILQETGDNSGEGTGSGLDSVATLQTTIDLFLHGGNDPFKPNNPPVTSWVQKYAPAYDLPHVFVSNNHDSFNRNVILSRYPFADLNGDGRSQLSDIPFIIADLYAPGGAGGIRGFMFAEIDLPDDTYAGDLVVGNAHLKSGGDSSSMAQRLTASRNVAYYIDYLFNGGGTETPDPRGRISDNPPAASVLGPATPVVIGGDWNEDENTNGRKGPAEWLARAELTAGTDGTDRDRSDSVFDDARDPFNNSRTTLGSSKLDYIAWQDSIVTLRRSWIFNSGTVTPSSAMPPELIGYPGGPNLASAFAADHRPVLSDLRLPLLPSDPPVLMAIDPASGPMRGGNAVDLMGTGFSSTAGVFFGSTAAPIVSRTGSTHIRALAPASATPGSVVAVSVAQGSGQSTMAQAYTYTENPIELVMTGVPRTGQTVTFTVYGPPNRRAGFALGPPGSLMRVGLTFCFTTPLDVRRHPMDFNTGPTGQASVSWTVSGTGMRNGQAVVRTPEGWAQTNCVSLTIQP